jgi:hypothetical protein
MASKNRETEIALQKLAYTEKQAAELTRLRKIEAAARALTVDFNPMFDSGAEFNITPVGHLGRLRKLYVSIIENKFAETETDG